MKPTPHLDPRALARAQVAADAKRCRALPHLFERKMQRMSASPLAFLRGSAPMFYAILRARPDLAAGPSGEGWIAGDLHLENFGAYRPSTQAEEHRRRHAAVFDLNDFDDAVVGPWRWEVLRLVTSLLLASRELRIGGPTALDLADSLVASYVAHAFRSAPPVPLTPPAPVQRLLDLVSSRSRAELLAARTRTKGKKRVFQRGARYLPLARPLEQAAGEAFRRFAAAAARDLDVDAEAFEIQDLAFRVAGTGSLGAVRVAVLTRGLHGSWIFDMKEQGTPSAAAVGAGKRSPGDAAARVVTAMQACLEHPPRMLGTTRLGATSMLVRRLSPQDDKLDLTRIAPADLAPLARYVGALTGAAHRRGARRPPRTPWTERDRTGLVDRAVVLAGLHEAAYLAWCRLRPSPGRSPRAGR